MGVLIIGLLCVYVVAVIRTEMMVSAYEKGGPLVIGFIIIPFTGIMAVGPIVDVLQQQGKSVLNTIFSWFLTVVLVVIFIIMIADVTGLYRFGICGL